MVIRSNPHKNGFGVPGFNELSFEDEKGREEVDVHAQQDMNKILNINYYSYIKNKKILY